MRPVAALPAAVLATLLLAGAAHAAAPPGSRAPEISAPATDGKPVKLSDHKGKWVVLEWINPGCPYVQKHYTGNNMQAMQKDAAARGVVWLSVNSTNPSHHDYLKSAAMAEWMRARGGSPRATLMDEFGDAGRAYSARTTPQMVVIDPKGTVVYHGAIDDRRSTRVEDIKDARNHVRAALDEAMAGKPVSVASTTPYGCSVKY